jgi:gas vesicle protein GvpL/GvpF
MSSAPGEAALRRNGSGWYLYGVVAADEAPTELGASPAVDPEHEVVLVREGPLAGVASQVSLEDFDDAALPERLGDTDWLEQKIRAHEQVLEKVLAKASVVPCRFCTVYRSEDELRRFLDERSEALSAALDRVRGLVEIGVKVFVDRERFAAARATRNQEVQELQARASSAGGGRAYLESRRLEQLVSRELERFTSEAGDEIHTRLLAAAKDGLALPLQAPELSGREDEMIFNGAYLVNLSGQEVGAALEALAAEYREAGVHLELTGPWPAYNFVPAELGAT